MNSNLGHSKWFNAKLLLFGEYTVLLGSAALALPLSKYKLRLSTESSWEGANEVLKGLSDHIQNSPFRDSFELDGLNHDIEKGLGFESNIPIGYGLGSSGALVAAVYDKYCISKPSDLLEIRNLLAEMENFFHGESSGIDPFVSFVDQAVLRQGKALSVFSKEVPLSNFFLIDTGQPRSTASLVNDFNQRCQNDSTFTKTIKGVIPTIDSLIESLSQTDQQPDFERHFKELSQFQLDHLSFLIPEDVKETWKTGLENNSYYLKLCGAGGGGFFMGYKNRALPNSELSIVNL